jgi:hypothetical protein
MILYSGQRRGTFTVTILIVACCLASALTACGNSRMSGPRTQAGGVFGLMRRAAAEATAQQLRSGQRATAVGFHNLTYDAAIYNAGTMRPVVVFDTQMEQVRVGTTSSARSTITVARPSRFASIRARDNWRVEGSPPVLMTPGMRRAGTIHSFSFLPQGSGLHYREVRELPATPGAMQNAITAHLRPLAGNNVPPTLMLKAYGFLLATAPLSAGARAAIYVDMASLEGIRSCGQGVDMLGREAVGLCVASDGREVEVLLSPKAGAALAVEQRITATSPLYPGLPVGTLVESNTFSS